ncbi:hypothetical protein L596_024366 [Steinernema carpocapsae]|uniref:Uncharacterized protein n=1 Tax=Steinernema carpocapsae TaxID=34508 RepID=A0A4U5MGI8_STECR|nr:hypothetical protein L596_024366 [Steinernema carpocapsae]
MRRPVPSIINPRSYLLSLAARPPDFAADSRRSPRRRQITLTCSSNSYLLPFSAFPLIFRVYILHVRPLTHSTEAESFNNSNHRRTNGGGNRFVVCVRFRVEFTRRVFGFRVPPPPSLRFPRLHLFPILEGEFATAIRHRAWDLWNAALEARGNECRRTPEDPIDLIFP